MPRRNTTSADGSVQKRKYHTFHDKNAPKQPKTAYTVFYKDKYAEFQKQYITAKLTNSKLASTWAEMNELEKKPYMDGYAERRQSYLIELEEYRKTDKYKEFQKNKTAFINSSNSKKGRKGTIIPELVKVPGINVFSEEFIAYNKEREKQFRNIRSEINYIEGEIELIDKGVNSLKDKLTLLQKETLIEERDYALAEKTTERWRRLTLQAFEDSRLLVMLQLTKSSSAEQVIHRLGLEAFKSKQNNSLIQKSLANVIYGSDDN